MVHQNDFVPPSFKTLLESIPKYHLLLARFFTFKAVSKPSIREEKTSPNVLMISIDDLNDWIGVLGVHPDIKNYPHLDRLANEGINWLEYIYEFTNAHCQAPIWGNLPSRGQLYEVALLSGLRPSTSGVYGQIKDKNLRSVSALKEIDFLPQYFGNHGYKTLGVGKIFHGHAPNGVFEVSGGRINGFGPKKKFKWHQNGTFIVYDYRLGCLLNIRP